MSGCLKWGAIGCGVLFALGLVFVILGAFFFRQAVPEMAPMDPVRVEGECPEDVVRAVLDEQDERLETAAEAFESIGKLEGDAGGIRASIDSVDLAALRATRDRLLATDVPPCAEGLLEAEADMIDAIVESVESMRACGADSSLCLTREMIAAFSRFGLHSGRISEARLAIAGAAGIDPEEFMDGGGWEIEVNP